MVLQKARTVGSPQVCHLQRLQDFFDQHSRKGQNPLGKNNEKGQVKERELKFRQTLHSSPVLYVVGLHT